MPNCVEREKALTTLHFYRMFKIFFSFHFSYYVFYLLVNVENNMGEKSKSLDHDSFLQWYHVTEVHYTQKVKDIKYP